MANAGFNHLAASCSDLFVENFDGDDYVVCPSGSCVLHVKEHVLENQSAGKLHGRVLELTEFIHDVLGVKDLDAYFPHKVGYLTSCHGQRGLHLSSMSELVVPAYSKPEKLLRSINGLELFFPSNYDECCGFGGTFCVTEEAVSVKMGKDRLTAHLENKVEILTGNDMSCLMHLEGIIRRNNHPIAVMHIAEILNKSLN